MRRKRLCIVYWNLGLGGIQKRIRDMAIYISDHSDDWDVYILLRKKSYEGFDELVKQKERVYIRYYPYTDFLRPPLGYVFWILWQYFVIKPDAVLTFQCLLSTLLVLCKNVCFWIPSRLTLNEGAVTTRALQWEKISYLGFLIRYLYPKANSIIVPTQACKVDLQQNFSLPEDKIIVIPNWTMFPPGNPLSPRFDIVYVGRFSPEKNPLSMIDLTKKLIRQHPNIRIALIGNGALQDTLIKEIHDSSLQKNIRLMEFSQDVGTIMRHSRILVVPSFNEGMPNVVLEAAMCAVPSVVNNFPGAEEVVVSGKTGYIGSNVNEIAYFAGKLLQSERIRKTFGRNAKDRVVRVFTGIPQRRFISVVLG